MADEWVIESAPQNEWEIEKPAAAHPLRSMLKAAGQGAADIPRAAGELGREVASLPGSWAQAGKLDFGDLLRHPGSFWEAGKQTAKNIATPFIRAAPAIAGGMIGGGLGGPPGAIAGASIGAGLGGTAATGSPEQGMREMVGTGGAAALGAYAKPLGVRAAKATGRAFALPSERLNVAAPMVRETPNMIRSSDAPDIDSIFNQARATAAQSQTTAPLPNTIQRLQATRAGIQRNPFAELQDTALLKDLGGIETKAQGMQLQPGQFDRVIADVNGRIGSSQGPERGAWKQVLGGLHEDMRQAYTNTGDPAFKAYSDAIAQARLQHLADDLNKVIAGRGVRERVPGEVEAVNPGTVLDWIKSHPEWVAELEKASPGTTGDITALLREAYPIARGARTWAPGATYGSGQFTTGAGAGLLLQHLLGIGKGVAAPAIGLANVLRGYAGIPLPQRAIRGSFRPGGPAPSAPAAVLGAGASLAGNDYLRRILNPGAP